MVNTIFFVSSNSIWGGSEILWSEAAGRLSNGGYAVTFSVKYAHPVVEKLKSMGCSYVNLSSSKPSLLQRIFRGLTGTKKRDRFFEALSKERPSLVVISQGNNIDGGYYMNVCQKLSIPYVTLTQLVTEVLWLFNNDQKLNLLRNHYVASKMNYFVSQENLRAHDKMIGESLPNSTVVSNPFTVPFDFSSSFPLVINGIYRVAMVGRLDVFHKGHDLLLEVLKEDKWKSRPIIFSFYGDGPHRQLLERLTKLYEIKNVVFKGHVNNPGDIWKENHLLILPSRMEGQSLALIEAMWCSRAAVLTDVGGARELVTDSETGFIAPYPSSIEIDAALERAWQMRGSWHLMGNNAGQKIRTIFKEDPVMTFTNKIKKMVSA